MPHVINAEHFFIARAASLLDGFEDRGNGKKVILDDMHASAEADTFGLASAGAVDHAIDVCTILGEELLDNRCVGAGGTEECIANGHVRLGECIAHFVGATIQVLLVSLGIAGLGVFFEIVRTEQIVARAGQTVATDAGVFESFIAGLPGRGEAHDGETGFNLGVIDHIAAVHDDDGTGVDCYGAGQIADVGCFTAATVDADAVVAEGGKKVFGAGDELGQGFAGNGAGVTVDRTGNEDAIDCADAEQVVDIHDEAVLGGLAKASRVAGFAVVEVGEGTLRTGSVRVNDITLFRVAGQDVGPDLTESTREDAAVQLIHNRVDFGFRGGDAALGIPVGRMTHR